MIFTILGILGGVGLFLGDVPYAIDAYRRKTQPQRVTWCIIFLLNVIAVANQAASGATDSLWLFVGATIATFFIALLSFSRGVGGYSRLDIIVMIGAAIGLLLWWRLNSPLASIIANVVVASLALAPTYIKAYRQPESETKITWLIGALSAVLATISVGKLDYVLLILPIYSVLIQGGVFVVLQVRGASAK